MKKHTKYKRIIFFFVLLILGSGFFLRSYALSSIPPHPSLDEVSIGYNAYSILETGKDEFGSQFPILLRAYDDYRPALYVYLVIPFVKLLGLSVLAVRFPSLILSVITIAFFHIVARCIFRQLSFEKPAALALVPTVLLAISPWHIYLSRLGHEVNAYLAFFIIGFGFFLNSIKKKDINAFGLIASSAFFSLSFSAYQSGKIFVPLFILLLIIFYFKMIKENYKKFIPAVVIGVILCMPILISSFQPEALVRLKATSIFNVSFETSLENAQKLIKYKENSDYANIILYNRHVFPFSLFVSSFISHFDYRFVYGSGNYEQFKIPGFGLYYVIEIPLLTMGILYLFTKRKFKWIIFLLSWYIIGVLPSVVSTHSPHAMRAFAGIGPLFIVSGLGMGYVRLKKKKHKTVIAGVATVYVLFVVVSVTQFFTSYTKSFPKEYSSQFQYGVIQAMNYIDKFDGEIVISNRGNLSASYMYYLFANKYSPQKYQSQGGTISGWFNYERKIGKVSFRNIEGYMKDNVVLVINPQEYKTGSIIHKIKNLKGEEVILIVQK